MACSALGRPGGTCPCLQHASMRPWLPPFSESFYSGARRPHASCADHGARGMRRAVPGGHRRRVHLRAAARLLQAALSCPEDAPTAVSANLVVYRRVNAVSMLRGGRPLFGQDQSHLVTCSSYVRNGHGGESTALHLGRIRVPVHSFCNISVSEGTYAVPLQRWEPSVAVEVWTASCQTLLTPCRMQSFAQ